MKYIRALVFLTAVALLAWLLPWGYGFIFSRPGSHPFTLYSCVTHSFAYTDRSSGKTIYKDYDGHIYTDKQFDSILPTFFYRQLVADGRLPEQIEGIPVDARRIQQGNFMFRHSPVHVNVRGVTLYPLLESMPDRVDLEMPGDVFRMDGRMEFVDMETNRVNEDLSQRFTKVLLDKGFVFPVRYIAGNPTVRKEYDEGYLIIDRNYQVFHVKRIKGRPFVRNTGISPDLKMKYAFVTEFRNRRFYGILTDADNRTYVLDAKTYNLKELPLGSFNPEKESMTIFGDDFYWTVSIGGEQGMRLYAVKSGDYSLADTAFLASGEDQSDVIARYLFPFKLSFTSYADKFVYPRLSDWSVWALILNVLMVAGYVVVRRREPGVMACGVVLLFLGLYALIPFLLKIPFVKR